MSVKLVQKENFSENMFINLERPDEDKLLQKNMPINLYGQL